MRSSVWGMVWLYDRFAEAHTPFLDEAMIAEYPPGAEAKSALPSHIHCFGSSQ